MGAIDELSRRMYHTQEKRKKRLTHPIKCTRDDAWLGTGYYFWDELEDAVFWGETGKRRTNEYEIFEADINIEKVLDTVFNEKHYRLWFKQIEKIAKAIIKKTNEKATVKEINEYLIENPWIDEITGILFQDMPKNNRHTLVDSFYYKKRIQLVAYTIDIISRFKFNMEGRCTDVRPRKIRQTG